jgi:hypothetical protein
MGTSFVEYGEFGFWTRDSYLKLARRLLDELRKTSKPEPRQESLTKHWRVQLKVDGGCLPLGHPF